MVDGKPKRPISIWLAQSLLLILALWVASLPFLFVRDEIQMFESYGVTEDDWTFEVIGLIVVSTGLFLPFAIALLIAFLGLAFRKGFGRWLSIVLFSSAFLLVCTSAIIHLQEIAQVDSARITDDVKTVVFIALSPIFLLLTLSILLGKNEKAFFRGKHHVRTPNPPPPPTFDD